MLNNWMGGAALLGVGAALWGHIKFILYKMVSLVVVTIHLRDSTASGFMIYADKKLQRWISGQRSFGSRYRYIRPLKSFHHIVDEKINVAEPVVLWRGWAPIVMKAPDPKELKELGQPVEDSNRVTLRFLRGTWDINTLLKDSINAFNETMKQDRDTDKTLSRRFFTHRFVGSGNKIIVTEGIIQQTGIQACSILLDATVKFPHWKREEIGIEPKPTQKAMDNLAFPPVIQKLVNEVMRWKDSKEWYINRGIVHQRGWNVYGPPGNGKSSLIRAIAQDVDIPIVSFDLSSMSNMELTKFWQEAKKYSPCITLFEDIDAVFQGRENITGEQGGGVTFDCFLNCINGVEQNDGMFIIITTNHIDKIDPALGQPSDTAGQSTRPGRIDRVIYIGNPNSQCRRKIAEKILSGWPEKIETILQKMDDSWSAAQVQEECIRKANQLFWKEQEEWHPPLKMVS